MKALSFHIHIPDNMYIRNPQQTELGRKILTESISIIDQLGFEKTTFRKIGERIGSNESSIYRYFENKKMLLRYLTCWYWSWVELKLEFAVANIKDPEEALRKAIAVITDRILQDTDFSFIDEVKLQHIIMNEGVKAYHTKEVDECNRQGHFAVYKRVVEKISDIIIDINPGYAYPHMLVSMIVEGSLQQRYFADHLPKLTDLTSGEDDIYDFAVDTITKTIQP